MSFLMSIHSLFLFLPSAEANLRISSITIALMSSSSAASRSSFTVIFSFFKKLLRSSSIRSSGASKMFCNQKENKAFLSKSLSEKENVSLSSSTICCVYFLRNFWIFHSYFSFSIRIEHYLFHILLLIVLISFLL
jgi:DNA phosphorothioation-dependent restriction protein DptG